MQPSPLTCIYYFSFYRSGDHQDLHSFPTRRSSDLPMAPVSAPFRRGRRPRFPHTTTHPKPCSFRERDRKSTRLNSSHVRISYAVFCLKKKMSQVAAHRGRRLLREADMAHLLVTSFR